MFTFPGMKEGIYPILKAPQQVNGDHIPTPQRFYGLFEHQGCLSACYYLSDISTLHCICDAPLFQFPAFAFGLFTALGLLQGTDPCSGPAFHPGNSQCWISGESLPWRTAGAVCLPMSNRWHRLCRASDNSWNPITRMMDSTHLFEYLDLVLDIDWSRVPLSLIFNLSTLIFTFCSPGATQPFTFECEFWA